MEQWGLLVPPPPAVGAWLADAAIPLKTVEPGSGFDDLEPFRDIIGESRLVALGESTHGTREFFRFKHRMLEFCVSELGFDWFGIEANLPECLAIDRYVRTGDGDPSVALLGQFFWTWDTEEVIDLIEWLRGWNATRTKSEPVRFLGFDMQFGQNAAFAVIEAARVFDPNLSSWLADATLITSEVFPQIFGGLDEAAQRPCLERVERLCELALRAGADRPEIPLVAAVLRQALHAHSSKWVGANYRDRCMADNVGALVDYVGGKSRGVLWAHNGHVQRPPWAGRHPAMGGYLHDRFGPEYLNIGLAFSHGGFQAMDFEGGGLRDWTVDLPPIGTLDRALADVGVPTFALDLRDWSKIPDEAAVWLERAPSYRSIGAAFGENYPSSSYIASGDPRHFYDVLVYTDETTPARAVKREGRGKRTAEPAGVQPSVSNLDFQELDADSVPVGWRWNEGGLQGIGAHELSVRAGEVVIRRDDAPWRAGDCSLAQRVEAAALVSHRVTLSAETRASGPIGSTAWMSMRAFGEKPEGPVWIRPPQLAAAVSSPIGTDDSRVELSMDVPEEARSVTIELRLAGNGEATFRNLEFAASAAED